MLHRNRPFVDSVQADRVGAFTLHAAHGALVMRCALRPRITLPRSFSIRDQSDPEGAMKHETRSDSQLLLPLAHGGRAAAAVGSLVRRDQRSAIRPGVPVWTPEDGDFG